MHNCTKKTLTVCLHEVLESAYKCCRAVKNLHGFCQTHWSLLYTWILSLSAVRQSLAPQLHKMWSQLSVFIKFIHQILTELLSNFSQLHVHLDITLLMSSEESLWGIKTSCKVLQWNKALLNFLHFSLCYAAECTSLCGPGFSRLKRKGLSMAVFGRKCGDWYLFHSINRQKQLCDTARHPATCCNCRLQYQTEG